MRTILITGATSGFGKLMTQEFLAHGDLVIATGRQLVQRNEIFSTERELYRDRLIEIDLDVTNSQQMLTAFNLIESRFKSLDILINNAGYGQFGALEEFRPEQVRDQMEVNFFGTVNVTQTFLPLLRQGRGKIFNFSSVFGFMGFPLTSLYCASKFAVEGLTESLRMELSPFGVQVCLIRPGGFKTDFGKNILWNVKDHNSQYVGFVKNYQKLNDYFSEKKTQKPEEVAKGVLKLSLKRNLPMSKVFGQDGRMSYLFKTFTPDFIYFFLFQRILNKFMLDRTNKL